MDNTTDIFLKSNHMLHEEERLFKSFKTLKTLLEVAQ